MSLKFRTIAVVVVIIIRHPHSAVSMAGIVYGILPKLAYKWLTDLKLNNNRLFGLKITVGQTNVITSSIT